MTIRTPTAFPTRSRGADDSDGDGAPNYLDFTQSGRVWPSLDPDGDALSSTIEKLLASSRGDASEDADGDGNIDYDDPDDDNDTVPTLMEIGPYRFPGPDGLPDTDGDGVFNHLDTDDDGDGVPTADENWLFDQDCDDIPNHLDTTDDRNFGQRLWQWFILNQGCRWKGFFFPPR